MRTLADFYEENHTYVHKETGKILPSVTSILKSQKYCGYYRGNGSAAVRGTAIHKATEEYDILGLEPDVLEFSEYVQQWRSYLESNNVRIIAIEALVVSEDAWYAGKLDRLVDIDGKKYVLDIKTGNYATWHQYQLAAYAKALKDQEGIEVDGGIAFYMKKEEGLPLKYRARVVPDLKWTHSINKWEKIVEIHKRSLE